MSITGVNVTRGNVIASVIVTRGNFIGVVNGTGDETVEIKKSVYCSLIASQQSTKKLSG
jgi:hypothetical protein